MDQIQLARGCWTIYIDMYFPSSTIFTSHCKWSTRVSISTTHPCILCLNMMAHGDATIREHLQQASFCCLDDAPVGVEKIPSIDFGADKTPIYWDLWGLKFLLTLTCPFTSLKLVWRIIQIGLFLERASTMKSKPPVFVGGISWTEWHLVSALLLSSYWKQFHGELVHSPRCRPAAEEQSLTITTLKEPRPGKRTSPFAIKQVSNNTIDELRVCLFQ